ncbi:hypothetical protein Hdeb2414_s0008g00280451 [Helianthus debilis subsp. tardiflorus]
MTQHLTHSFLTARAPFTLQTISPMCSFFSGDEATGQSITTVTPLFPLTEPPSTSEHTNRRPGLPITIMYNHHLLSPWPPPHRRRYRKPPNTTPTPNSDMLSGDPLLLPATHHHPFHRPK